MVLQLPVQHKLIMCGTAFNGELEASYQMKVGAVILISYDGVEVGTTYTFNTKKIRWWNTIKFIFFNTKL